MVGVFMIDFVLYHYSILGYSVYKANVYLLIFAPVLIVEINFKRFLVIVKITSYSI